jgi:chorismate mutase
MLQYYLSILDILLETGNVSVLIIQNAKITNNASKCIFVIIKKPVQNEENLYSVSS